MEMRPPTVGTWLVESAIGDHQLAGMRSKLLVYNPRRYNRYFNQGLRLTCRLHPEEMRIVNTINMRAITSITDLELSHTDMQNVACLWG